MGFFDLNIPYLERDGSAATASQEAAGAAIKAGRVKVVVKAMELGYTGVAYNRTIRGVVSDADRCKISPLPLSSLLKVAPALAAAARFHRELLGVPLSSPFRQYTRLTVAVDSALGAAALHPGNAVLRTYHLVAVRPLNQAAFDQACKVSEVDLISIDFSQKLPFRLKLAMVKAAIERGVYFEVTYSHLISDIHIRRQMLSNAKLLVDWTRGKSLIFSSGTSNVNEVRGPYDVINLSSLLGLSVERAKVAISRNCRSLLNSALRRKLCYKEAIRIEKISPSQCSDTKEPWFVDWANWDPISSGEGDLPALDDIARFFSASGQDSKGYSEINFHTVSDGVPFERISNNAGDFVSFDDRGTLIPVTTECEPSIAENEASCQDKLEDLVEDEILLPATPLEGQLPENESDLAPSPDFGKLFPTDEHSEPAVTENEGCSFVNKFDVAYAANEEPWSRKLLNTCNLKKVEPVLWDDSVKLFTVPENPVACGSCVSKIKSAGGHDSVPVVLDTPEDAMSLRGLISGIKNEVSPKDSERPSGDRMEVDLSSCFAEDARSLSELFGTHDMPEMQVLASVEKLEKEDSFTRVYDILFQKDVAKSGMIGENDTVPFPGGTRFNKASDTSVQDQREAVSVADNGMPSKDLLVNMEQDGEVSSAAIGSRKRKHKLGKVKFKRKLRYQGLPLLSKLLMHHPPFKKVVHSKGSSKNLVRIQHDRSC